MEEAGKDFLTKPTVSILSSEQQEKLRQFKIQTRNNNEKYLRAHPEVEEIVGEFLSAGSAHNTLLQPVVWLTIALATAICVVPVLAFRFLKLDLKPQLSDTVRYTQLVRQKRRKPAGRSIGAAWSGTGSVSEGRLGARGGSRRSGYAFSHQEGFGELITSGKNMRLSSLALANFASKHSSSWIETLCKKKNTHTPPSTSGECSPAPSNMSGMGPALSNSSSVLGGSQETPIEEETDTAVVLSSSSHPAALEQAEPRASAQVAPPDSSTSAAASTESPGGWTLSLETVQEALFGRRGCASASYSQGPPSDARETPHTD